MIWLLVCLLCVLRKCEASTPHSSNVLSDYALNANGMVHVGKNVANLQCYQNMAVIVFLSSLKRKHTTKLGRKIKYNGLQRL